MADCGVIVLQRTRPSDGTIFTNTDSETGNGRRKMARYTSPGLAPEPGKDGRSKSSPPMREAPAPRLLAKPRTLQRYEYGMLKLRKSLVAGGWTATHGYGISIFLPTETSSG